MTLRTLTLAALSPAAFLSLLADLTAPPALPSFEARWASAKAVLAEEGSACERFAEDGRAQGVLGAELGAWDLERFEAAIRLLERYPGVPPSLDHLQALQAAAAREGRVVHDPRLVTAPDGCDGQALLEIRRQLAAGMRRRPPGLELATVMGLHDALSAAAARDAARLALPLPTIYAHASRAALSSASPRDLLDTVEAAILNPPRAEDPAAAVLARHELSVWLTHRLRALSPHPR